MGLLFQAFFYRLPHKSLLVKKKRNSLKIGAIFMQERIPERGRRQGYVFGITSVSQEGIDTLVANTDGPTKEQASHPFGVGV